MAKKQSQLDEALKAIQLMNMLEEPQMRQQQLGQAAQQNQMQQMLALAGLGDQMAGRVEDREFKKSQANAESVRFGQSLDLQNRQLEQSGKQNELNQLLGVISDQFRADPNTESFYGNLAELSGQVGEFGKTGVKKEQGKRAQKVVSSSVPLNATEDEKLQAIKNAGDVAPQVADLLGYMRNKTSEGTFYLPKNRPPFDPDAGKPNKTKSKTNPWMFDYATPGMY